MTVAAYRDTASGEYPLSVDVIRGRVNAAFGTEPSQDILDLAKVDAVNATAQPAFDPVTQFVTEGAPAKVGFNWQQTWIVSSLPVQPSITFKTDIWRRCTEAEAAILDQSLDEAPVKMRRLWDDSTQIESTATEFAMFRSQMVLAFGETRTAQILAPSEG